MKNVLNNKVVVSVFLFFCVTQGHAQILDWIGEQIKGYVEDQIVDYAESQLGNFGTALWDGIVEAKLQGDLSDEMKKFDNFEVSEVGLNNVDYKYGLCGDQSDFRKIYWNQSDLTKSYIFSKKNVKLGYLGKGTMKSCAYAYIDSVSSQHAVKDLRSALNQEAMDSVTKYSHIYPSLASDMLKEVQADDRLAYVFNNRPLSVRMYINALEAPMIKCSPSMLIYWASQADTYYNTLPKKHGLPQMSNLKFRQDGNRSIVSCNGTDLAEINEGNKVTCMTLDLLNMRGMSKTAYVFGNTKWETDAIGRVVCVRQNISISNKGKCKLKSKVKSKNFVQLLSNSTAQMQYYLGDIKFGAPDVLRNVVYIVKDDANKQILKEMKKKEKLVSKTSFGAYTKTTNIEYDGGSMIPKSVIVSYNGSGQYRLNNR